MAWLSIVLAAVLFRPAAAEDVQPGPRHAEADALLAKGRFDEAVALYRRAVEEETRRPLRRQMIAQMVRCYRALGQLEQAGEAFLLLVRDDPQTPSFDCIPLAWLPRQPSVTLEQAARRWLARPEPAAALLGASHLLTTSVRATALERLRTLTIGGDRRVAQLALAQIWRTEVATATDEQLQAWGRAIEQMPEAIRAGPYFVLGTAYAQRQQWQAAALALMRVAILHPQERELAAQSLLEAGRALEKLGQTREATRVYQELLRDYPEQTRATAEAEGRAKGEGELRIVE